MTGPHPPPGRLQSSRERLLRALSANPLTLRDLSLAAGLSEREVLDHMAHLQKSLRAKNRRLAIVPSTCLDCHFIFNKRERLARPGKCPICRSTHLSGPRFCLEN